MNTDSSYSSPFLPSLTFLMCMMVLVFSSTHLFVHVVIIAMSFCYENFVLRPDPFRKQYMTNLTGILPLLVLLFLFYGIFLQIGQTELWHMNIAGISWTIYQESLLYGLHYVLLFVELFWVTYLVLHEKKIDQIQCFFHGSLFVFTLIWNGSIQQAKQLFTLKKDFDLALLARGKKLTQTAKVVHLFEYSMARSLSKIYVQMPIFKSMWKNKQFFVTTFIEKLLWVVPVLFWVTALFAEKQSRYTYTLILALLALVGIAMLHLIVKRQHENMCPPLAWQTVDRVLMIVLACWGLHRVIFARGFELVSLQSFVDFSNWHVHDILSMLILWFVLLVFVKKTR